MDYLDIHKKWNQRKY